MPSSHLRLIISNISWVCTTFSRGFPLVAPWVTSFWLIFSQSEKVTGRTPLSEHRHEPSTCEGVCTRWGHAAGGAASKCLPTTVAIAGTRVHAHHSDMQPCHTFWQGDTPNFSMHALSCVSNMHKQTYLQWFCICGCTYVLAHM